MKKTKLLTLCGVLAIGASLLGSTQVYAYENGQNDPHAATNTLEVKKTVLDCIIKVTTQKM
jgi:predicted RNA methylase